MPGTGRWTSDDASLEARLPGPLRQFLELYGASRFWDSPRAQLKKTLARLDAYPAAYLGLDVAELRAHCLAVRQEVAENPDNWPDRVTALPLSLAANRLRGDEVELGE